MAAPKAKAVPEGLRPNTEWPMSESKLKVGDLVRYSRMTNSGGVRPLPHDTLSLTFRTGAVRSLIGGVAVQQTSFY